MYGTHIVADFNDKKGLDAVLESLKYFKEAAKNHYWPAAFMFYQATEEIRKSGTAMPNYIDVFKDVEWYKAHHVYGMFEVLCGSDDYDRCAYHFQKALWLRDDKTESAGFLAFLLNAGLVRDSIANGLSSGSIPMYYEAGLKAEDENTLCQVGLLFFAGIVNNGIREMEDSGRGKDLEKAYEYLHRSYLIFSDKVKHNQPVMIAMYGLAAGLLGSLCFSGEGTKKDLEAAFNYLTVGHNLDDPQSTYLLAACYKEGFGVKKNEAEANRLMKELNAMPLPGVDQFKLL